jgi:RNA polymerase sigma factor (sigma-70 family)
LFELTPPGVLLGGVNFYNIGLNNQQEIGKFANYMSEEELIKGCLKYEHVSQRELYQQYFSKMMHICIRYARNQQEAKAILLDGFKNVFNEFRNFIEANEKIKKDAAPISLEEWIKKEMIASAVRHMHDSKKEYFVSSTVNMRDSEKQITGDIPDERIIKSADKDLIIKALQQLTPSYRAIYNLSEIDGYSHLDISKLLDISEYTSKDSLTKAKFNLRKNLAQLVPKKVS